MPDRVAAFAAAVQQLHESAQRVTNNKEIEMIDPRHPDFSMRSYPDGRIQFKPSLGIVRYMVVTDIIKQLQSCDFNIKKIVDLGCSDKSFLMHGLLKLPAIRQIVCIDQNLGRLVEEKKLFQVDEERRAYSLRVRLIEADILDIPRPIGRAHVVTLIEVIEHFKVTDLPRLLWIVFSVIKPHVFIVTTPNSDFNLDYPLPGGKTFRHDDHKFEWNQNEFQKFCKGITDIYPNYSVAFDGCGYGGTEKYCTQIALFCIVDFCLSLEQQQDIVIENSALQEVLSLNGEKLQRDNGSSSYWRPGSGLCPVPFSIRDHQGKKLNQNEKDVNYVLSQLHSLVTNQAQSIGPNTDGGTTSEQELGNENQRVDNNALDTEGNTTEMTESDVSMQGQPTPSFPGAVGANGSAAFFTRKYSMVQDITYDNVETMYRNKVLQEVSRFVWCCSSHNIYYPFTDKIEKFKGSWNFLNCITSNNGPVIRKNVTPYIEKNEPSFPDRKLLPRYTDDDDGACSPEHKNNYTVFCKLCPFICIKKKLISRSEDPPKIYSKRRHQSHVVYENFSGTKLWFSYFLIKEYLGILDGKFLRDTLGQSSNYSLVEIKSKKRGTYQYYSCIIGEEDECQNSTDDEDDDDDGAGDEGGDEDSFSFSADHSDWILSCDESSAATNPPPSPAPPSREGGKAAGGNNPKDSFDLYELHHDLPQEEGQMPVKVLDQRVMSYLEPIPAEKPSACAIQTVSHGPGGAVSNMEWTVANSIAAAFSTTMNADKNVLTKAILCALTTVADMKAASASAEPADRCYDAGPSDIEGEHGMISSTKLHSFHVAPTTHADLSRGSRTVPSTGDASASSGNGLKTITHSALGDEFGCNPPGTKSISARRASLGTTARIRSNVTASTKARGALTGTSRANTATTTPIPGTARVSSSSVSASKVLPKVPQRVTPSGGGRLLSSADRNLPKEPSTITCASRTTTSATRTVSAPTRTKPATTRTVSTTTRTTSTAAHAPTVSRTASLATRPTVSSADGASRIVSKPTSHRPAQPSSSRGARASAAAPARGVKKEPRP